MTSLRTATATVSGTISASAFILAGAFSPYCAEPLATEPGSGERMMRIQLADATLLPLANTHWNILDPAEHAPSAKDFYALAMALAGQQELLGSEMGRILADRFEDLLD